MATAAIAITPGSGDFVRVVKNSGVDSNAAQQVFTLAGADGQLNPTDPDGTQNVSTEATTLFSDDFSGTLSNTWTSGGTAPTTSAGQATFASSTTASAASYMRSIGTFPLRQASYLRPVFHVQLETGAVANSQRWWGIGLNQGSPTAAAPVLNGAVFELNYADGTLRAAIYSNGTRVQVAALTRPTDGALHRYELWYRQSRIDWVQDGVVVATRLFPNLAVANNLALIAGSINHTTAPSAAPVLVVSNAGVADHSGTNRTISDGAQPWIQASVKAGSTASVVSDQPLVAALHPSSPLPAGANQVGALTASQTSTATAAAGTAVTVTLTAPGASLRHYVTAIAFERFAAAALTASATPIVTTASNHNLVTTMPADAAAQGTMTKDTRMFTSALASTAQNTATSFTAPATTNVIWRVTVHYYTAA